MIVESVGLGVKQTWAPLGLVTDCVTALSLNLFICEMGILTSSFIELLRGLKQMILEEHFPRAQLHGPFQRPGASHGQGLDQEAGKSPPTVQTLSG